MADTKKSRVEEIDEKILALTLQRIGLETREQVEWDRIMAEIQKLQNERLLILSSPKISTEVAIA